MATTATATATTTATTDTRRRVKLYALNAERQWDDRGTGHVSSNYVDRLKGISLLVRAELDGSLLLESKIQPDTAYQKQQDTLIVWSEGDNFDLALSFQEKAGCDEIWERICQVQGKDPSVEITQEIVEESEDERFDEMSDTAPPIELPPCELSRLEDISETIQNCLATPMRKDKLAMALESENYIKKLLNLFHVCEDLENTEGLHHLFDIFKNIFLLNKNALFEIMFADDTIFDVVGCLEYDPNMSSPKKHRHYLKNWAKFREAIPIKNQDLLAKIHQTFRVQYIQDIILPTPSVFVEDNMLNTLSSFIFFNKVEIVTLIQEDERFLIDMFTALTDPNTSETQRLDIVLFLKEFCCYAQNLQPQGKDSFYKTLTCLGILQALEIMLVMTDLRAKAAAIDVLNAIVEFSPLVVRNYSLQQANRSDGDRTLLNVIIEQMLTDTEPELGAAVQLMSVVKILLEPENMLTEKGDFLNYFYKHSVQILIAPLIANTVTDPPLEQSFQTAQLLAIVLEILSFCVEHHTYHIKNFIIQKDLLKRILLLMKSTHTFLVLSALRLLRKIIALKDEFYNRHIVKGNLFAPVVDAFIRNNGRYNLLESAILELFEFVKLEDIKTLCIYFVENFSKIFDEIEYVQTFKYLKSRYDQYQDRLKDRDKVPLDANNIPILRGSGGGSGGGGGGRYRRDQRQLEEEEEIWFNDDDDYDQDVDPYSSVMKSVTEKNGPQQSTATGQQQQQQQQQPPQQKSPPQNSQSPSHGSILGNSNSSNISNTQQSPMAATTTTATASLITATAAANTLSPSSGDSGSSTAMNDTLSGAMGNAISLQQHLLRQQELADLDIKVAGDGVGSPDFVLIRRSSADGEENDPDVQQRIFALKQQQQENNIVLAGGSGGSPSSATSSTSSSPKLSQTSSLANSHTAATTSSTTGGTITGSPTSMQTTVAVTTVAAAAASGSPLLNSVELSDPLAKNGETGPSSSTSTATKTSALNAANDSKQNDSVAAVVAAAEATSASTVGGESNGSATTKCSQSNENNDNRPPTSDVDGGGPSDNGIKKGLVDYESDSAEEEEEEEYEEVDDDDLPQEKKARLA